MTFFKVSFLAVSALVLIIYIDQGFAPKTPEEISYDKAYLPNINPAYKEERLRCLAVLKFAFNRPSTLKNFIHSFSDYTLNDLNEMYVKIMDGVETVPNLIGMPKMNYLVDYFESNIARARYDITYRDVHNPTGFCENKFIGQDISCLGSLNLIKTLPVGEHLTGLDYLSYFFKEWSSNNLLETIVIKEVNYDYDIKKPITFERIIYFDLRYLNDYFKEMESVVTLVDDESIWSQERYCVHQTQDPQNPDDITDEELHFQNDDEDEEQTENEHLYEENEIVDENNGADDDTEKKDSTDEGDKGHKA